MTFPFDLLFSPMCDPHEITHLPPTLNFKINVGWVVSVIHIFWYFTKILVQCSASGMDTMQNFRLINYLGSDFLFLIKATSSSYPCQMIFNMNIQGDVFLWLNFDAQSNLSKLRYRGLVVCILLCEVCGFVTYLSFDCEVPGLFVLYSRTKMLKLRKSQTLHQKNPHFWIFLW